MIPSNRPGHIRDIYTVVAVVVLELDTVRLEQFVDLLFGDGFYFLPVAVLHAADGKFTHFLRKGPSVFSRYARISAGMESLASNLSLSIGFAVKERGFLPSPDSFYRRNLE